MTLKIDTTKDLKAFCKKLSKQPFITVDTEFLREKTYRPILCLVQVAAPDESLAACIDPLATDIDLTPLLDLMRDEKVLKVFHSARQDLEIFYELMGEVPAPLFDTQVAAMVCGLGDCVSYHSIVHHYLNVDLDKSSRVTDWSKRPLSETQLKYALADVTHLVHVYEKMREELQETGRQPWVTHEMNALLDPALYQPHPDEVWQRLKTPSTRPEYLGILRAICAWREEKAVELNKPRRHILRDETVLELAALAPKTKEELKGLRAATSWLNKDENALPLLTAIAQAKSLPKEELPHITPNKPLTGIEQNIKEMLRLLLTIISNEVGVASKVIASSEDLELMARSKTPDVPAMSGWRYEVFGQKALAFKNGELMLFFNPQTHKLEFLEHN